MKILFLHGWTSKPGGVKPTFLAEHGHEVFNPALPDEDFAAALAIAQGEFDRHTPDVVVGSSRGGAIAMNLNVGTTPLVLLCPAWKKWGSSKGIRSGTTIIHSRADDVVPFADSEELIRLSGLPANALVEVGVDHRLADRESLAAMLKACETSLLMQLGRKRDPVTKGRTPGRFFVSVTPSEADIQRARELPLLTACPRRYCWWWQSLSFDWDTPVAVGCKFRETPKPASYRFANDDCSRMNPKSLVDQYEPREPHLESDGFQYHRFCGPDHRLPDQK